MSDTERPEVIDERERQVLWIAGYRDEGTRPGSFYEFLIEAFFRADKHNRARLNEAFPTTAEAFRRYMEGESRMKFGLEE